jgi:hypothetical protein
VRISPAERVAPWVAGLLLAAPLVVLRYPPMTDLPHHEGMVAILRHGDDPAWFPPGLYVTNLVRANQLFELLALALSYALGVALACKTVVAGTLAATIVAGARLAAYFGRTRWIALALAPIALGWIFYWGFVGNTLGLAILLAALPGLDRAAERATWRSACGATVWLALLLLAHATSMLCGCGAVLVFALARGLDRRAPWRLAPIAAAAVLMALEMRAEEAHLTPLTRFFASRTLWKPLPDKLTELTENLFGGVGRVPHGAFALLLVGLVVAGVILRLKTPCSLARGTGGGLSRRVFDHRLGLVAAGLGLAYLAAPYSLNFGAFLFVRFLAPAVALALLATAPRAGTAPRLYALAAAVTPVGTLLVTAPHFAQAAAQSRAVDALLARVDAPSAFAVLHFGGFGTEAAFAVASAGNRALPEKGGRLLFAFTEYPIAPVQVPAEHRWDTTLGRVYWDARAFVPEWDFRRIGYLLVHVEDPTFAMVIARAMEPDGTLMGAEGDWLLFRASRPPLPMTAPDAPLPNPAPERLDERVRHLLPPR